MDDGETVVVGTSKVKGGGKALIALLKPGRAIGRRRRRSSRGYNQRVARRPPARPAGSPPARKGAAPRRTAAKKAKKAATNRRRRCQGCGDDAPHSWRSSERQHPNADTELNYRNAVRAARGDHPLRAVHRRAGEPGDAGAVRALSRRRGAGATRRPPSSSPNPVDRLLPREIEIADRHGDGHRRTARRRSADHDGGARRAPGRRPQDSQRGARPRARRPGLPVDRHVLRVSNRIGIARSDDPVVVEQQLCAALPPPNGSRTPTR